MQVETSTSANANIAKLRGQLQRTTLDVLWTQWRAVGAHAATRTEARALVDPEALLLTSLALAGDEPRLDDLAIDWSLSNARLLSVQRMKNLTDGAPDPLMARVAALARILLDEAKDIRWRPLADAHRPATIERRTNKRRARETPALRAGALWLRLRLGVGVGIKADTLAFLLGTANDWANVRTITIATGYSAGAVRRALDDLAEARFVQARTRPRASIEFRARAESWQTLLGVDGALPSWMNWRARFAFVRDFLAWTYKVDARTVSRYAFGVHGRELLARHAAAFGADDELVHAPERDTVDWADRTEAIIQAFAHGLERDV